MKQAPRLLLTIAALGAAVFLMFGQIRQLLEDRASPRRFLILLIRGKG